MKSIEISREQLEEILKILYDLETYLDKQIENLHEQEKLRVEFAKLLEKLK
jgi:hypothetical protein